MEGKRTMGVEGWRQRSVNLVWVRREENKKADALANKAMDSRQGKDEFLWGRGCLAGTFGTGQIDEAATTNSDRPTGQKRAAVQTNSRSTKKARDEIVVAEAFI